MYKTIFQKQAIMRRVIWTLLVILAFSTYLYGFRVLLVNAVVLAAGTLTEFAFERSRNKKVSEAVFVTSLIYGLALPPLVPIWVAVVGIVFAVAIGKGVYGGFGRNVFNPAITGRLFVYITFPTLLQANWVAPRIPGFAQNLLGVDGVTAATPLEVLRGGATGSAEFWQLFFGFRAGSMGEGAIWLILIAAVYLGITKTAQWRLMISTFLTGAVLTAILYFTGLSRDLVPHLAVLSGSLLYVSVFMVTDPVSAPNKPASQWLYGVIIGGTSILIRTFAGFPEGTSFGILLGNTFAALIDEIMPAPKRKKKPAPTAAPAAAGGGKE